MPKTAITAQRRDLILTVYKRHRGDPAPAATQAGQRWGEKMWGSTGWGAPAAMAATLKLTASKRDLQLRVNA